VSEKAACDMARSEPLKLAGGRPRRSFAWKADRRQRSPALLGRLAGGNGSETGLAGLRIFHIGNAMKAANGPIAQLDRVTDFYSVGCRFESCWDRQSKPGITPLWRCTAGPKTKTSKTTPCKESVKRFSALCRAVSGAGELDPLARCQVGNPSISL
jgi:hypothetical protein